MGRKVARSSERIFREGDSTEFRSANEPNGSRCSRLRHLVVSDFLAIGRDWAEGTQAAVDISGRSTAHTQRR